MGISLGSSFKNIRGYVTSTRNDGLRLKAGREVGGGDTLVGELVDTCFELGLE